MFTEDDMKISDEYLTKQVESRCYVPLQANLPKNTEKLVNFRITVKQRSLGNHFSKDTTNAPLVNCGRISG